MTEPVLAWVSEAYDEADLSGELMKFRLVYDGRLPSAGSKNKRTSEKHAIRKELHRQLRALWNTHPSLRALHDPGAQNEGMVANPQWLARHAANYKRCDHAFAPLVCDALDLVCHVDILMLRHEAPGALFQGGDLDNRLKTLFDALKIPDTCEGVTEPEGDESPFMFVLLDDDKRVAGYTITTDRLLTPPSERSTDVRLVIEVTTRALKTNHFNLGLL
jgi:hypothetical protein